jgi:hypothetical protein
LSHLHVAGAVVAVKGYIVAYSHTAHGALNIDCPLGFVAIDRAGKCLVAALSFIGTTARIA